MTFEYTATHQSATDASPAMMVCTDGYFITLVNEDGFIWTDLAAKWVLYGSFEPCCENYVILNGDIMGNQHCHDCPEYDGAPVEQWEVTEPADVYYTDEYYSGTGELIGDDSYIDYLNR